MYAFNSSRTIDMTVNDASVASIIKLSMIRLDSTLDNYLEIRNKSSRCSVHRLLGIYPKMHTFYCSNFNV